MSTILSRALIESQLQHEKYQMGLPFWDKFVIWSYTIGSGTVNSYLLGNKNYTSLYYWSERVLITFIEVSNNRNYVIPVEYKEFIPYLRGEKNINVYFKAEKLIELYIKDLQRIILNSPPLLGNIIVYKASSPYPGLKTGKVYQDPFNSTSYKANMNFSMFLKDDFCCMHKILIEKGLNVLIISPHLSAYPYECEVLLPHSSTFDVIFTSKMTLEFPVVTQNGDWIPIQKHPYSIGPLYDYNYKNECSVVEKKVKLYNSVLLIK